MILDGKQIITTYCHLHSPFGKENRVENESKINAARRILRYKRNTIPIIATPKITTERWRAYFIYFLNEFWVINETNVNINTNS